MSLYFFKYHGAGNDFIVIDDRNSSFPESKELISDLCHRRFGIGSDGIMLIKHSDVADVHLDFINPDGSRSFCGNGSRCGLSFAYTLGMIKDECTFEAIDGLHQGRYNGESVTISMSDVTTLDAHPFGMLLDTGSPHLIIRRESLDGLDVKNEGSRIRYSDEFKEDGVNVNFVQQQVDQSLSIRTYERGVEDETLSCGTGVTAAALAMAYRAELEQGSVSVHSLGGELRVDFERSQQGFKNIYLTGPAVKVFGGEIHI
jgi:diaminopimelate epimerase